VCDIYNLYNINYKSSLCLNIFFNIYKEKVIHKELKSAINISFEKVVKKYLLLHKNYLFETNSVYPLLIILLGLLL